MSTYRRLASERKLASTNYEREQIANTSQKEEEPAINSSTNSKLNCSYNSSHSTAVLSVIAA